jgi:hypothetical protein
MISKFKDFFKKKKKLKLNQLKLSRILILMNLMNGLKMILMGMMVERRHWDISKD